MQEPGPGLAQVDAFSRARPREHVGAVRVHVVCCVSRAGGLSTRGGGHRAKAWRHASYTEKKERSSRSLERRLQTSQGLVGDEVGREVWAGDGRPYVPRSTPPGVSPHCCAGMAPRAEFCLFPFGKEPIQILGLDLE